MSKRQNKYIVTGGRGFIGSHVVELLLNKGHQVLVVDDKSGGEGFVQKEATYLDYDLVTEQEAILNAIGRHEFMKANAVFHLAAKPRVQYSLDHPLETHEANVTGTLSALEITKQIGTRRFVYSSSSSVYGDQASPEMEETMDTNPISPYAMHKLMGEQYCQIYGRFFDLQPVALRYFNVYGPRQKDQGAYALVIAKFMKAIQDGKPMTVYGDGKQTRDYTWVKDVAGANWKASEMDYSPFNIIKHHVPKFNIGTGLETDVESIAFKLADLHGLNIDDAIEYIKPNPRGDLEERRKVANIARSKQYLDYTPSVFIGPGLEKLKDMAEA